MYRAEKIKASRLTEGLDFQLVGTTGVLPLAMIPLFPKVKNKSLFYFVKTFLFIRKLSSKLEFALKQKKPAYSGLLFYLVEANGENANKFNEHLKLILDFMGVLEHEPELMERLKIKHNLS